MWRSWSLKSTLNIHSTSSSSSPSPSSSSSFSFSSFKDVQSLCTDDPPSTKKPSAVFRRVRLANAVLRSWSPKPSPPPILIPGADKRIVVYFTSLRVVRSTFEACRVVRSILRGLRVKIDERDLSMDAAFLGELQQVFGGGGCQSALTLPRVFIGGRYVGGEEEIRQLHEAGELKKLVEGLAVAEPGWVCDVCGGYRFVLCEECSGGHKVYIEKVGFKCCTVCNENGLIRCPSCSS